MVPPCRFRAVDGSSCLDDTGEWLDARLFAVAQGGLYNHPSATIKLTPHGLGDVYGMWIYDMQTHQAQSVLPADNEHWPGPVAATAENQLMIYATAQDRRDGRVARRIRP